MSHRSAAALWGMLRPYAGPIEVTLRGNGGREKRKGIKIHRSSTLIAGVVVLHDNIAVTRPKRTLRDLHRTPPQPVFRLAVRRALDLRLIGSSDLRSEDQLTRSELERLFLALCRRHRLPQPEVNARVGQFEVDFLWRDRRLIVETDGFQHHWHRDAFEGDRARDTRLQCQGFRVVRFTYRQIIHSSAEIAASLRDLFDQRSLTPNL